MTSNLTLARRAFRRFNRDRHTIGARTAGYYNDRLDGMGDILLRAPDASILDIGCNRGLVSFQFAVSGAKLVHGCDIYESGVEVARHIFADLPIADARFEVADLTGGGDALKTAFGADYLPRYDIVLFIAVHQKLMRVMSREKLNGLVHHLAARTGRYLCCRTHADVAEELASTLGEAGLRRIHYSELSLTVPSPAQIWTRA